MKKSKIDQRREYVKDVINSAQKTTDAVKQLSNEPFFIRTNYLAGFKIIKIY